MNDGNTYFVDLFAGIGGTRLGFEKACHTMDLNPVCVGTSEIKSSAIQFLTHNFIIDHPILSIEEMIHKSFDRIDVVLAGFPCQSFSSAGKQRGLKDSNGRIFFYLLEFIAKNKPRSFILENVPNLLKSSNGDDFELIQSSLQELGYMLSWKVLDSRMFGCPQIRKRIIIVGTFKEAIELPHWEIDTELKFAQIKEDSHVDVSMTPFATKLFELSKKMPIQGKKIQDRRGGNNNIHSWELREDISPHQKRLLNIILRGRRYKRFAHEWGISWTDGMPLTIDMILSLNNNYQKNTLITMLDDLLNKGILVKRRPKDLYNGVRKKKECGAKGYDINKGKLSFEFSHIQDDELSLPTLVASDCHKIGILTSVGIRKLSKLELFKAFGWDREVNTSTIPETHIYNLLGNSICVPMITAVSLKVLEAILQNYRVDGLEF